ncbi:unnamed protein product [Moneuplotes crassus]|uniref:Uncharacterized protein n=1 Tax=Euplotes crassus TaxID=5936 RepID=A0AAD2D907_EUPCR|nr:unnamed protein product [Moneuplotes crassus]
MRTDCRSQCCLLEYRGKQVSGRGGIWVGILFGFGGLVVSITLCRNWNYTSVYPSVQEESKEDVDQMLEYCNTCCSEQKIWRKCKRIKTLVLDSWYLPEIYNELNEREVKIEELAFNVKDLIDLTDENINIERRAEITKLYLYDLDDGKSYPPPNEVANKFENNITSIHLPTLYFTFPNISTIDIFNCSYGYSFSSLTHIILDGGSIWNGSKDQQKEWDVNKTFSCSSVKMYGFDEEGNVKAYLLKKFDLYMSLDKKLEELSGSEERYFVTEEYFAFQSVFQMSLVGISYDIFGCGDERVIELLNRFEDPQRAFVIENKNFDYIRGPEAIRLCSFATSLCSQNVKKTKRIEETKGIYQEDDANELLEKQKNASQRFLIIDIELLENFQGKSNKQKIIEESLEKLESSDGLTQLNIKLRLQKLKKQQFKVLMKYLKLNLSSMMIEGNRKDGSLIDPKQKKALSAQLRSISRLKCFSYLRLGTDRKLTVRLSSGEDNESFVKLLEFCFGAKEEPDIDQGFIGYIEVK